MFVPFGGILMIFTEKKIFYYSSESSMILWDKWEIRIIVLLSLLLQIVLISLGNQRKYRAGKGIAFVLWLAYLSADSVATIALGILSRSYSDCTTRTLDPNYVIIAFWAPFLLLHLGGPDTITAYSLEDNELWLRHLLVLIVEAGVAFYVFFKSLKPTQLNFVALPIFVAGLIKYGERNWVLRSSSSKHFKNSLLSRPDPGPNYAKFMEEYILKDLEGYKLSLKKIQHPEVITYNSVEKRNENEDTLNVAYDFFLTYRRLFADLILSFQDLQKSQSFFQEIASKKAFKIIEIELEFMYGVLFTKAVVNYSFWGGVLRFISLSSTISALVAFSIIDWEAYSLVNVGISLLLLIGAIGLEIYAIFIMLYSDWTMLWLSNSNSQLVNKIYTTKIVSDHFDYLITSKKRWSDSIAQYNLLSSCFKDQPATCYGYFSCSWIYKLLVENIKDDPVDNVSEDLKKSIFEQILGKSRSDSDVESRRRLCSFRGYSVLEGYECLKFRLNDCLKEELRWSVEVEFDQSILLWHIATDLCYYSDYGENENSACSECTVSKLLSNYMMHILVKRNFILPDGIGQIRFQDTVAEASQFIEERKLVSNEKLACSRLLAVDSDRIEPADVKGDRSKSVLFNACRIAKLLQFVQAEKHWGPQKKWEMISNVWVEMLLYAASHCRWNYHAQELRRGGELLTHVWLLMAHLGISEQFQISEGHARAKWSVE